MRLNVMQRLVQLIAIGAVLSQLVMAQDRSANLREQMVATKIEAEGITSRAVLSAMRLVPRHEFVPKAQRSRAYEDTALAIGHEQTISPPFIVAYMTETLDPQPDDRVLEIGTGSGYQAAVLSAIVKEVYTIEIVSPLSKQAAERLEKLGYSNGAYSGQPLNPSPSRQCTFE